MLNIDHHVGNTHYGAINWSTNRRPRAASWCSRWSKRWGAAHQEIATHIYLALLTDTGSFHFSHITPRSFEIARRCVEAGADPQWIARTHYDSSTLGARAIFGHVLNPMRLDDAGASPCSRSPTTSRQRRARVDDTEGIINFPLR